MNNPIIPFYKQGEKIFIRSENCNVYDSENNKYVDFESGDWAANLGHSNKEITNRIKIQVDKLIHDGLRFRNHESEQLAIKLLDRLGLRAGQCVFLNSGSEAVNLGITLAKHITGRSKVLKMDCSYLSAFGHGQISNSNPDLISVPFNNSDAILKIDFNEIAVFVFEPGNSSSLIKYPDTRFIDTLSSQIKAHNGFLMANEVTTGFGRTGKWFGFQHYAFSPDIVSVGKALGNGYPISGVAISRDVADLFKESPFRYAQSHQNDPLGCAIGLEVINILEKQDLINKASSIGEYFRQRLIELQNKNNESILEIRARGLMIGLELKSVDLAGFVYNQLIDNGFLTGLKEKTIRFMPPLTIEQKDIDHLIETLDRVISSPH